MAEPLLPLTPNSHLPTPTRDALIEAHRHLVPLTLKRAVPRVPVRIDPDDLLGAGYVALVQAADRFDPARGVEFATWAICKIRGAMLNLLREDDWAPRSVRDRQKAGEAVLIYEVLSLEEIRYQADAAGELTVADQLPDPAEPVEAAVPTRLEAAVVGRLVESLPRRLRHVVRRHYWDEEPFRVIAYQLGRSESRVHQLHDEALMLLKAQLVRWRPEVYAAP